MNLPKGLFLAVSVLIYGVFGYMFFWRIYNLNEQVFLGMPARLAYREAFLYIPSVLFLLYGALILGNLYFRQGKMIVFNSFFAASLLLTFDTVSGFIGGGLAGVFGLVVGVMEYRNFSRIDHDK